MADIRKYNNNNSLDSFFDSFFMTGKFPPVDIYENPNEYVIKAELAGYDEGKINLYIEKHVLHIASGEKEEKHEDKDRKYLIRERAVRSFERSFTLTEDAAEENLTATYKQGVLTVVVPKLPKEEPKKIEVRIN